MSYQIIGTVKLIEDQQTFSSGFCKQEFVVTTEDKYPQDVKLEAVKEKCEDVAKLSIGDRVDVSFNIRGNEYQNRYFVNLQAWKIEVIGKGSVTQDELQSDSIEEEDVPF